MHNTPKKYMTFHSMSGIIVSRGKGKAPSPKAASAGKEDKMEEMAVFKGYLRSLMRQLKLLKKAIDAKNFEQASILIDELIEDTQSNIED